MCLPKAPIVKLLSEDNSDGVRYSTVSVSCFGLPQLHNQTGKSSQPGIIFFESIS